MKELADQIVAWLKNYAEGSNRKSFVVGVSGGVDSGLVSTLCAMTGMPTYVVTLPCQSNPLGLRNADLQVEWLKKNYPNVQHVNMDLTSTFEAFAGNLPMDMVNNLGFANAKSRLRMIALYHVATVYSGLVVGTGNKVEDFGVGFFTKYGDGGVDISPIADLMKSEVRNMAVTLQIPMEVATAVPTDGLWEDTRTDESQLGASYEELEWAMKITEMPYWESMGYYSDRQKEVLKVYTKWHNMTAHKMRPIPTFKRL